jgi:Holliday junction resolvase RusA-like endonuclease
MATVFPWRAQESQRNRLAGLIPVAVSPDVDNLAKLTLDVMTDAGFWGDDGQVAILHLSKWWGDLPGIRIEVRSFVHWGGVEDAELASLL